MRKHKTFPTWFYNKCEKIIINEFINNNELIRYDFKIKNLINLILREKINENLQWFNYDIFKKYLYDDINRNNDFKISNSLVNSIDNEDKFINENIEN